MGLMDKLKTQLDLWKLEKYTKRRQVTTPEFEQKGKQKEKEKWETHFIYFYIQITIIYSSGYPGINKQLN